MVLGYKSYAERIRRTTTIKRFQRVLGEALFCGVVGAVTGMIAGPPGMMVGGGIGFLVGLLAGMVAEQEDARAAIRERRLDAEIGVTSGSLGTKWPPHVMHHSRHDTIPNAGPKW